MVSVDTNILIRIITRDDEEQAHRAEAFIRRGAWVSLLVLAETIWVLARGYGRTTLQLVETIEVLIAHEHLRLEEPNVVEVALAAFKNRPAIGFSDYLIFEIARKAGHTPLGTFDRNLAKLDGVEKI